MYKHINISIFLYLNLYFIYAAAQQPAFKEITQIPSDITLCSETDKNLNECVRNVFQQMLSNAVNGIPELNIPPTEPLEIEKNSYEFSNNVVQGKVAVRNVKISGVSKTVVNSVDYKKEGDKLRTIIKSKTPGLFIEGKYKAEVRINNSKINSKGDFNLTMTDIDATLMTEGELYERNGQRYIRLTKFNIDPTLGNMKFYATGLMPDPVLNDTILEFINQNWRNVYKSFIRDSRSTWEPEFLKMSNEYFSHLPYDLLIPKE